MTEYNIVGRFYEDGRLVKILPLKGNPTGTSVAVPRTTPPRLQELDPFPATGRIKVDYFVREGSQYFDQVTLEYWYTHVTKREPLYHDPVTDMVPVHFIDFKWKRTHEQSESHTS